MRIVEAEWAGKPTFFIEWGERALWKIVDGRPAWVRGKEWAWHTPSREKAELVLEEIRQINPGLLY